MWNHCRASTEVDAPFTSHANAVSDLTDKVRYKSTRVYEGSASPPSSRSPLSHFHTVTDTMSARRSTRSTPAVRRTPAPAQDAAPAPVTRRPVSRDPDAMSNEPMARMAASVVPPEADNLAAREKIAPRKSGRQTVATERKAEALHTDKRKKANATKKAAQKALRARQAIEEDNDFAEDSPESEEEYLDDETLANLNVGPQFTVVDSTAVGNDMSTSKKVLVKRSGISRTGNGSLDNGGLEHDENEAVPVASKKPLVFRAPDNLWRNRLSGVIPQPIAMPFNDSPQPQSPVLRRRAGHVPNRTPVMPARHVEVPHRLDAQQLGIPRAAQIAYAPVQLDEEDLEYLSESGDERSAAVEVPGFAPRGPLTAANNLRRPRPAPSGPTMETTRFTKKPKVEAVGGSGTRGRVLDSDFPREKRGAVKGSQHHFRCLISSDAPFPNTDLATEFCREAWGKACKDQGIDMEFGPLVVSMLTDRAPQIRGEIKIKARTLVPSYYKLLDKNSKADAQTIRARVEMLKDNEAFVHENPEERTGRYKHPIIQAVINETWYSSQRDEGVEYSEYFSEKVAFNVGGRRKSGFGIPLVTIALVLTAVQCALDEWATGQRSGVEFSEKTYGPVFEHHLSKLDTLKEKMADMEIVERIQSQLLDGARDFAKVPGEDCKASSGFDETELENMRREWAAAVAGVEN